jgi:hypothetical protein
MAESTVQWGKSIVLFLALVSSKRTVSAATPEMATGIRDARWLKNLFIVILLGSFAQAFWATFISGSDLPLQPVALHGGVKQEKASTTFQLSPAMNPLQLLFARKTSATHSIDYNIRVLDASGIVILTGHTGDYKTDDANRPFHEGTSLMDIFEVPASGVYTVEVEAVQDDSPTVIQGAALGFKRNAMDSHFILTLMLSPLAVWLAIKWWRYRHGWIWETLMGEEGREVPLPPPPLDASPVSGVSAESATATAPGPAADSPRLSLRDAFAAVPMISLPVAVASPRPQAEIVVTRTLFDRIKSRAIIEFWSLLLSAAQVPLVGGYTMLVAIIALGTLGGTSPATVDALMQSPVFAQLMQWFFPAGHYEGFAAAWQMGQAGGVVLLVFHLLMTPTRLLRPRRQPRSFIEKTKLLIKLDLLFVSVTGVLSLVNGLKISKVLDAVTILLLLLALLFVPTLVLISVSTKLQEIIDGHQAQPD